jgi:DNA-binding NarL/FixJ family response regulator
MKGKSRIFIVDDHPIVRLGLRQLISLESDMEYCGEAASANEAISKIVDSRPDLVIVDISLEGDMSGFDLIRAIDERHENVKTIVISMFEESFYVDKALRSGARGYIAKKHAYSSVIEAIRKVSEGEIYLSGSIPQMLLQSMYHSDEDSSTSLFDTLSKRELEIFQMIGNGFDTQNIAKKLGITANTVQTYKRHIKEKLGTTSHNDLVRRATLFVKENF